MTSSGRKLWRSVRRTATRKIEPRWASDVRREIGTHRVSRRGSLRVWWWRGNKPNFGDELTWILLEAVTGRRTTRSTLQRSEVVGVGSNLEKVYAEVGNHRPIVLGSGFLADGPAAQKLGLDVRGVRGRLSLERMPDAANSVVVADPGLLAPVLVREGQTTGSGGVAIVPHYVHADAVEVRRLSALRNIDVLDVRDNPISIVNAIAGSSLVVSSSLHGIITADALGVPNLWVRPAHHATLYGDDYKFRDYFSGLGRTSEPLARWPTESQLKCCDWSNQVGSMMAAPELVNQQQERLARMWKAIGDV